MRFRFGDCCCVSGITMSGGIWDWYRDYVFGASGTGTANTNHVPRTASIYIDIEDPYINNVPGYYDSYSGWYVDISDSNFQKKNIISSIETLGLKTSENVYIYAFDSGPDGTFSRGLLKIDAENENSPWTVTDQDWIDSAYPTMDYISIGTNVLISPGATPDAINYFPVNYWALGQTCAHHGGVRKILINSFGSYPGLTPNDYQDWTIDSNGNKDYAEYNFYFNYPGTFPLYTETYSTEVEVPFGVDFNTYALPVGGAPQANLAIGIYHPHFADFPEESPGVSLGNFPVEVEVYVGPVEFDEFGIPYVAGGTIWTKTSVYRGGSAGIAIETRIDGFDAITTSAGNNSIALITYRERLNWNDDTDLFPYSAAEDMECFTKVIIGGVSALEFLVFSVSHLSMNASDDFFNPAPAPLWVQDNRDFYPKWINPRCLHSTESYQGGGQKFVLFQRVPSDRDTADAEWEGNSLPGQWILKCFSNTNVVWEKESDWGRSDQSFGTVIFDTDNTASIDIAAVPGGQGDGDLLVGQDGEFVTFTIEFIDRVIEDAVFDSDTNTLTIYIDITGGNDTIQDMIDIINAAGDFYITGYSNETDTVTTDNIGMGELNTGSDNPSGSPDANRPYIHDSSDRYMYVVNFPMRVRQLVENRWTCLFQTNTFAYFTSWMISHDGTISNPVGLGVDRYNREQFHSAMGGNQSFSCIKNSSLIPLCPVKEEY